MSFQHGDRICNGGGSESDERSAHAGRVGIYSNGYAGCRADRYGLGIRRKIAAGCIVAYHAYRKYFGCK